MLRKKQRAVWRNAEAGGESPVSPSKAHARHEPLVNMALLNARQKARDGSLPQNGRPSYPGYLRPFVAADVRRL